MTVAAIGAQRAEQDAHDQVGHGVAGERVVADAAADRAHDAADHRGDQEQDDDHAEHAPGLARHELTAAPQRAGHPGAVDHDRGRDDGEERERDQPGHDDQDEPDR